MRRYAVVSPFLVMVMLMSLLAISPGISRATGGEGTPVGDESRCPSPLGMELASPEAVTEAPPMASPGGEPICVSVLLGEYYIMADRTTFRVGETYIFAVGNEGEIVHEFVIEPGGSTEESALEVEENGEERESEIEDIDSGETVELEWTFTEPGTYQFACHLSGHFKLGMVLEIEVVE